MNSVRRSHNRITLLDVARNAGVSRATASLVVRGSPLVANETRLKVLAAMENLGYVYNRTAASLRTCRSGAVGLIVTEITNPFFAQMTVDCQSQFEEAGLVILLSNTSDDLSRQTKLLETMHEYGVDGLLLCPAVDTGPEIVDLLRRWQLPVVFVTRYVAGASADYVGADNVRGAELAVEYLIEQGHSRIAFIGGVAHSSSRQDRYLGYRNALVRHGMALDETLTITSPVTQSGGRAAILELLQGSTPPTAAFCYNDVVAFGVMAGLQSRGIIPGVDFSVIGFDDIEVASTWQPPLASVAVIPERVGVAAARLLLNRMVEASLPPQQLRLQPQLIVRQSCGGHNSHQ